MTTRALLIDRLTARGFELTHVDTYDRGAVRVGFDDTDVVIYRFTDAYTKVLAWSAHFSAGTPTLIVLAVLDAAEAQA